MTVSMDAASQTVPARRALPIADLAGDASYDTQPTRDLGQAELLRLASSIACQPTLWADAIAFDDENRHYVCLHHDAHVDIWLLCWTPSNDTGWHDHDISSGAVAVVQGRLVEHYLGVGTPHTETRIEAGLVFSFGPDHIHRLTGAADSPVGTVSVHAYSPPLWRLGQYAVNASGLLRRMSVSYADELRPMGEVAGA
jgi:quercetin dioxygenase-like cupin family protein